MFNLTSNRSDLLAIVLLLFFSQAACTTTQQPTQGPPNVILINADDLGFGDLSCYGATLVNTPNIDALAKRGRRFTDAHSPSAVCSPSRYGLLTGRYPLRRNIWGPVHWRHPLVIEKDTPTLGRLFKQAGYDTACVGKWHLGIGEKQTDWNAPLTPGPRACGFDYYFGHAVVNSSPPYVYVENEGVVGYDPHDPIVTGQKSVTQTFPEKGHGNVGGAKRAHLLYRDKEVGTTFANKSAKWIADRPKGKPYFLYLATTNIHHPFTPAKQFDGTSEAGIYGDFIHELDWMVGQVIQAVEARGELDNTLIIFTSDNGGMLNLGGQAAWEAGHRMNGDLLGFKFGIWEGGHRVPMIAAWPGQIPEGTESDALISQVDLFATFRSLLNPTVVDAAAALDSVDQLPELLGEADQPQREELVVLSNSPKHVSIRTKRWLYIPAQGEGGFGGEQWGKHLISGVAATKRTGQVNSDIANGKLKPDAPKTQLYDLVNDPRQTRNVVKEHPEVARRLHARVDDVRAQVGKHKPTGWIAPQ